ncbi:MAG: hypothetical protein ACYC5J_06440 [Chloroflexota bacterium]
MIHGPLRAFVGRRRQLVLALAAVLFVSPNATGVVSAAAGPAQGSISVSASSTARIVATFAGGPIAFDPQVRDFVSAVGLKVYEDLSGSGSRYYVRKGSGQGPDATVKSNTPWTGTVRASTGGKALPFGALRLSLSEPKSYEDCESAPVLSSEPVTWASAHRAGVDDFDLYYLLRLDPWDLPTSTVVDVTYSVVPAVGGTPPAR